MILLGLLIECCHAGGMTARDPVAWDPGMVGPSIGDGVIDRLVLYGNGTMCWELFLPLAAAAPQASGLFCDEGQPDWGRPSICGSCGPRVVVPPHYKRQPYRSVHTPTGTTERGEYVVDGKIGVTALAVHEVHEDRAAVSRSTCAPTVSECVPMIRAVIRGGAKLPVAAQDVSAVDVD